VYSDDAKNQPDHKADQKHIQGGQSRLYQCSHNHLAYKNMYMQTLDKKYETILIPDQIENFDLTLYWNETKRSYLKI
jgi:hypothetical protein